MKRAYLIVLAALSIALFTQAGATAQPKVEEQIVGPAVASGVSYVVSPRGVRLASVGMKGSRVVVTVDGVEGPLFDQMLTADGKPFYSAQSGIDTRGQLAAVIFSSDGTRYAYCAKLGNEAVIIVDGKEFARAPYNASVFNFGPLAFSPGGKHFLYTLWEQPAGKKTFFMDGKAMPFTPEPDPETNIPAAVFFSPDDSRYFYYYVNPTQANRAMGLVVDGADAGYGGFKARFTSDSKQIYSIGTQGPPQLLVDGKPALPGMMVDRFYLSRTGNRVVAVSTRPNPGGQLHFLIVDGKKIDASECINGIDRLYFSPDGKRYAARCKGATSMWMIIDGVKSQEYRGIHDEMTFSPDSSKFVYVASSGTKNFVIQDGVESSGHDMVFTKPVFSPDSKHLAFIAGVNRLNLESVVDGKVVSKMSDASAIVFSPDGSRYAIMQVGMGTGQSVIDGVEQKDFSSGDIQFSPDGKHMRLVGQRLKDRQNGLFINGEVVYKQSGRFNMPPTFSPDSKHIYWSMVTVNQAVQPPRQSVIFVDGKEVGRWNADINAMFEAVPQTREISPEGVLTALVATPEGIKRLRVTPDANTTIASVIADVKAAEEKAIADATKAKADADAAKAQAAADAQAARLKAQQDAAAARAARAARRGQPPPPNR